MVYALFFGNKKKAFFLLGIFFCNKKKAFFLLGIFFCNRKKAFFLLGEKLIASLLRNAWFFCEVVFPASLWENFYRNLHNFVN